VTEPEPARESLVPGGHRLTTPGLVVLATVAFVVEVALFGGVGAVGGGPAGWLAAAVATAAVLVLWGLFMAPKGARRLSPGVRTLVAFLLCAATAAGLVWAGWTWWGWFVGIAGLAVVAAQMVLHGPEAGPHGGPVPPDA
jgi:hypothetical protein